MPLNDPPILLAIDQGTTSTRAIIFDANGTQLSVGQRPLNQSYPQDGWVEHDPEEIWTATVEVTREALAAAKVPAEKVTAIGITNQRETTVVWEKDTGRPIYPAIVWQDRRTVDKCRELEKGGVADSVQQKTGLLLDPYFSGTKLAWMLDHVDGARAKADAGKLAFGTIDSWLIWHLSGGQRHVTDATNASRTMLFNIRTQNWDDDILKMLNIPRSMLPEVLDCGADFATTEKDLFGSEIPVLGVAGDQQAATVGQACFQTGMTKSTYGTGCFALVNSGSQPVISQNRLLGTVGYRLKGKVTYAIEGSIFMAGATVQWMRDGLKAFSQSPESEEMARRAPDSRVYLVPAFTGLGAPYWDPDARGAILGMTQDTGLDDIVRAGLESVCYQTRELVEAMDRDMNVPADAAPQPLRVDGGMVGNEWFLQSLADILGRPVERAATAETTALGAAFLAGTQAGVFTSTDDIAKTWTSNGSYQPVWDASLRDQKFAGWKNAVQRVLSGV